MWWRLISQRIETAENHSRYYLIRVLFIIERNKQRGKTIFFCACINITIIWVNNYSQCAWVLITASSRLCVTGGRHSLIKYGWNGCWNFPSWHLIMALLGTQVNTGCGAREDSSGRSERVVWTADDRFKKERNSPMHNAVTGCHSGAKADLGQQLCALICMQHSTEYNDTHRSTNPLLCNMFSNSSYIFSQAE